MALKDGGMSSYNQIIGNGTPISSDLTRGQAFPLSAITGNGTISSAALSMLVQLIATITGNGTIVQGSTTLNAILKMLATIAGSGGINTSPLNVIAWCTASVLGEGNITATMKGFAAIYLQQIRWLVQYGHLSQPIMMNPQRWGNNLIT
jgi:hypothetical protein